jgi:excisionase family DNA binding protein
MVVHWRGGDHTRLTVKKNRTGRMDWCTEENVIELVRVLARHMPDQTVAAVLNRLGKSTSHGHSWTRGSVCSLRHQYDIAIYRPGERAERQEATINEATTVLSVSTTTIRRLIANGALPATQPCRGAPWIIKHGDLMTDSIRAEANARRSRRPQPDDSQQNLLDL